MEDLGLYRRERRGREGLIDQVPWMPGLEEQRGEEPSWQRSRP
jgi:hypothetical protein